MANLSPFEEAASAKMSAATLLNMMSKRSGYLSAANCRTQVRTTVWSTTRTPEMSFLEPAEEASASPASFFFTQCSGITDSVTRHLSRFTSATRLPKAGATRVSLSAASESPVLTVFRNAGKGTSPTPSRVPYDIEIRIRLMMFLRCNSIYSVSHVDSHHRFGEAPEIDSDGTGDVQRKHPIADETNILWARRLRTTRREKLSNATARDRMPCTPMK